LKKVVFLIRSINIGGAEKQLLTLARGIDRSRIDPKIVTFYPGGDLLAEFQEADIDVISAQKKKRWDVLSFILELVQIIKKEHPDVIVCYLVAANLLGIFLKPFFSPSKIIISIRHSYINAQDYDLLTRILYFMQDSLGWISDRIIVNSYTGAKNAEKRGLPPRKMVVISNGIDIDQYQHNSDARCTTREKFGISQKSKVVGIIGRIDPVKDHASFIEAAKLVVNEHPDTIFMVVGDGDPALLRQLHARVEAIGLKDNFVWIDAQKKMLGIYNSLDVCVSSSIGEGFSNVIAEAMACEVPCVVTDVGDSSRIVGETGKIVEAKDPYIMAEGILHVLSLSDSEREILGKNARNRIVNEFSIKKMVDSTTEVIESIG
jgi:glycosyltransferase involved in cell wall biosynthesis